MAACTSLARAAKPAWPMALACEERRKAVLDRLAVSASYGRDCFPTIALIAFTMSVSSVERSTSSCAVGMAWLLERSQVADGRHEIRFVILQELHDSFGIQMIDVLDQSCVIGADLPESLNRRAR